MKFSVAYKIQLCWKYMTDKSQLQIFAIYACTSLNSIVRHPPASFSTPAFPANCRSGQRKNKLIKKNRIKRMTKKKQPPTYTVCNLGNIGTRFKSSCPQSNLHDSGLTRGILGSHHLNLRLRSSHKKQCQATKAQLATVLLRKGSK